jgi:hypothetical protein
VPAELFGEVTDLLRSKGFIASKGLVVSTVSLADGQGLLPLPNVVNASGNASNTVAANPGYVEASAVAVAGFGPGAASVSSPAPASRTKVPDIDVNTEVEGLLSIIGESSAPARVISNKRDNIRQFVPETPADQKEKAQRMRAQRMQAKKKAAEGSVKPIR